jgi:hypothetical protein
MVVFVTKIAAIDFLVSTVTNCAVVTLAAVVTNVTVVY